MEIPRKLYKYQPFDDSGYSLENLQNRKIWFSKPTQFNDPFDCSLPYMLTETSEVEWKEIADWIRLNPQIVGQAMGTDLVNQFDSDGQPNEEVKKIILEEEQKSRHLFERYKDSGVACFTTRYDNILMWSHYTNGHQGFCLEYDTNYPPFRQVKQGDECAYPVLYSASYPIVRLAEILGIREYNPNHVIQAFTTKSEYWRYEQEWRVLIETGSQPMEYEPNALTGVYFGCRTSDDKKLAVLRALNGYTGPIYQMKRSKKIFEIQRELVSPKSTFK